jgi:hypothetical protein
MRNLLLAGVAAVMTVVGVDVAAGAGTVGAAPLVSPPLAEPVRRVAPVLLTMAFRYHTQPTGG